MEKDTKELFATIPFIIGVLALLFALPHMLRDAKKPMPGGTPLLNVAHATLPDGTTTNICIKSWATTSNSNVKLEAKDGNMFVIPATNVVLFNDRCAPNGD